MWMIPTAQLGRVSNEITPTPVNSQLEAEGDQRTGNSNQH
jgi:hypothetical protein